MWMIDIYIKREKDKQRRRWDEMAEKQQRQPPPPPAKQNRDEWLSQLPDPFGHEDAIALWEVSRVCSWKRIERLINEGLVRRIPPDEARNRRTFSKIIFIEESI
jgi:hypothetical protein